MARTICQGCLRPINACWCHCSKAIDNRIEIGILQHPTEAKQVKSSVPVLVKSLRSVQLWQGETVEQAQLSELTSKERSVEFHEWLNNGKQTYLLYPPTEAEIKTESKPVSTVGIEQLNREAINNIQILVLDGTWRKTFKLLMLNPPLQALPRISLQPQQASQYFIRKQKDASSLSTLEAVAELLSQLQKSPEIRRNLNQAFDCFQKAIFHSFHS